MAQTISTQNICDIELKFLIDWEKLPYKMISFTVSAIAFDKNVQKVLFGI